MKPVGEDTFTAFIDLLGFSEASADVKEATWEKVLSLLVSLSSLRQEFSVRIEGGPNGSTTYLVNPAISTFSDHIVISYPLGQLANAEGPTCPFSSLATSRACCGPS